MAQAQHPTRLRAAQVLLTNFVGHATRPFSEPGLPNWYIYTTFVLLLLCLASVALNIVLFGILFYATL